MITTRKDFDLTKIGIKVGLVLDNSVKDFTKSGAKFMQDLIPVKSGKLKDSIHYDNDEIWTTSNYYQYVDEGVSPHVIEGNPLVFYINGIQVFTTIVNHPGSKAQKITEKTIEHIEKDLHTLPLKIGRVL